MVNLILKGRRAWWGLLCSVKQWLLAVALQQLLAGCYAMKQMHYQGNLLTTRQPIDYLLWKNSTPEELKQQLRIVQRIRTFAKEHGLNVGSAYNSYLQSPHAEGVSFLVQAALPTKMEAKTWRFPIVGEVPYLGYYHVEDRDHKAAELRAAGYDVHVGTAEAFSTLGWLSDPIFSSMLRRSEDSLAGLLFHELTHRSIWIPGQVEINEQLAEYVAETLTVAYIAKYGDSQRLAAFRAQRADRNILAGWIKNLKSSLSAIYEQPISESQKLQKKQEIIAKYCSSMFPSFTHKGYQALKARTWNNASILATNLYLPDTKTFDRAMACVPGQSMEVFLDILNTRRQYIKAPQDVLDQVCAEV